MSATDPTRGEAAPLHIEAICDGVPTQLDAEEIRVTLPNGIVFNLHRGLDPSGSIVADIPIDGPDADEFPVFVLRPGAANLLHINAERHPRRTVEERA
ncbi:hypothetical protein OG879_18165 [Streptomyces caniferus]|uniref:hypothetical protein n=1 Tax=Streptomyces caniferus TaxID=285557 RepID=UPI002E2CB3F2|nr:hypothetical protein [Streptomyces caniferus]